MNPIPKPTPNYTKGRGGYKPEMIIIHIMAGSLTGTDSWFANPASRVSSNYGIGFNGEIHQYVSDLNIAYAQGLVDNPNWTYRPGINPNKYCLSIENEGSDLSVVHEAQINALVGLIRTLGTKYGIPIDRQHIRGHYEIRKSKPNCPATDKSILDRIVREAQGSLDEQVTLTLPKSKISKAQQFLSNL